jgi:hypothetical protein
LRQIKSLRYGFQLSCDRHYHRSNPGVPYRAPRQARAEKFDGEMHMIGWSVRAAFATLSIVAVVLPAHADGPSAADWNKWSQAAVDAARHEVSLWAATARIDSARCKVNAVTATGSPGVLKSGYKFGSVIRDKLVSLKAPGPVAVAWGQAFAEAWQTWESNVTIPNLPWYPAFAAFPGPQAPPTPNVPTPLDKLTSPGRTAMKEAGLTQSITARLGSHGQSSAAKNAVKAFASDMSKRFSVFLGQALIMNVLGSGPVPSFKPPAIMAGPVVNGNCLGGQLSKKSM